MTKEILDKITSPNMCLTSSDMTAEEKKHLYAHLSKYDMKESKCYKRFFEKGFDKWEIEGVENILRQFLEENMSALVESGKKGVDRGYAYVLSLTPETYYSAVRESGLLKKFVLHMGTLGMSSNTVYKRFANPDWQKFELIGIRTILAEMK